MKWKTKYLGELCIIKGGKRLPKGHELVSTITSHLYIRARDIGEGKITLSNPQYIADETFEFIKRYIVNETDLVLTIVGANIGDVGLITKEFENANLTENAVRLISKRDIVDPYFLKYSLLRKGMKEYFQVVSSGAAQGKLGLYKVKTIKIALPPLRAQRQIASILSTYDDLIENNLKRIKLLEEIAQRTYEEWFVKFKVNGVQLKVHVETGLPAGWEKKRADELCDIKIGKTPPREQEEWFSENGVGIKWVSIKDINNAWVFIHKTSETVTEEGVSKFNMNIAPKGTVILSFKLTVGRVTITTEDMVTNEAIAHFNLKGGLMTKEFVYCYLKGFNFPSLGSTSSIGTAINSKIVKAIPFIVPGKDAMSSFSMLASPIFEQIENLQNQNIRLKEARDILLPRLMNGKIDLDSCESIAMASEPLVAYSTKRKAL